MIRATRPFHIPVGEREAIWTLDLYTNYYKQAITLLCNPSTEIKEQTEYVHKIGDYGFLMWSLWNWCDLMGKNPGTTAASFGNKEYYIPLQLQCNGA